MEKLIYLTSIRLARTNQILHTTNSCIHTIFIFFKHFFIRFCITYVVNNQKIESMSITSAITSYSFNNNQGTMDISGYAWSFNCISKIEVSIDGGKTFRDISYDNTNGSVGIGNYGIYPFPLNLQTLN